MATVRITKHIRNHVRNKLEALYHERIERKKKELQNLDIGNVCYLHYIPAKYRDLAQQLNADGDGQWLDTTGRITIEMTYLKNDANRTKTVLSGPSGFDFTNDGAVGFKTLADVWMGKIAQGDLEPVEDINEEEDSE